MGGYRNGYQYASGLRGHHYLQVGKVCLISRLQ
jgi:hypothetical protein